MRWRLQEGRNTLGNFESLQEAFDVAEALVKETPDLEDALEIYDLSPDEDPLGTTLLHGRPSRGVIALARHSDRQPMNLKGTVPTTSRD